MDVIEQIENKELELVYAPSNRSKCGSPMLASEEQSELLRLAKLGLEAEKRIKQLLESKYYQKDVPEPLQYLFCYYEFLRIQSEPLPELLKGESQ